MSNFSTMIRDSWDKWIKRGSVSTSYVIGISVSACILDIASGKVPMSKVKKIVAGTACRTERDWEGVITKYRVKYWGGYSDECERILREMLAARKISQPKLVTGLSPDRITNEGLISWVKSEEEINWKF